MRDLTPYIEDGIISAQDLQALLQDPAYTGTIKILDATFVLPGSPDDPMASFKEARIGNAQFFDIDHISDKSSPLPHMLPSANEFAAAAGALGLSNSDFIVVYAQSGMVMGPARAWWMFRTFGHNHVCVLDGGLPAWRAAELPINTTSPDTATPQNFTAEFHSALVIDAQTLNTKREDISTLVLDARPTGRFTGQQAEPRAGLNAGHIPSSLNIPASTLIDSQNGCLKDKNTLKTLLPLESSKTYITTCGSGVTAAVISLALYRCGYKDTGLYDGSWSEWGDPKYGFPYTAPP